MIHPDRIINNMEFDKWYTFNQTAYNDMLKVFNVWESVFFHIGFFLIFDIENKQICKVKI